MTKDKFNAIVDELWGEVDKIDPKMYEYYVPFQEQIYSLIISTEISSNLPRLKKKTIEFMVTLNALYYMRSVKNPILIKPLMEHSKETLVVKAAEYASDKDRLYNFKRAGELTHKEPEETLIGMASKHFVSVEELCSYYDTTHSQEFILEKFGDAVNYLILLYALIEDRENES